MKYAPSLRDVLADIFRRVQDFQASGFSELDVFVLGFQWREEHAVCEGKAKACAVVSKEESEPRFPESLMA